MQKVPTKLLLNESWWPILTSNAHRRKNDDKRRGKWRSFRLRMLDARMADRAEDQELIRILPFPNQDFSRVFSTHVLAKIRGRNGRDARPNPSRDHGITRG